MAHRQQDELAAIRRLYDISIRPAGPDNLAGVLQEILDTAISLAGADMGTLQLLDEAKGVLRITAHRGFAPPFLDFFTQVGPGEGSASSESLALRQRVFVGDVAQSPMFAGKPALGVLAAAGVQAVQSTPLVSREGRLVGMLATHYRRTVTMDELELRFIDLLAGQAADIIAQVQAQRMLRESEEKYRTLFENMTEMFQILEPILNEEGKVIDFRYIKVNKASEVLTGKKREEIEGKTAHELWGIVEDYWLEMLGRALKTSEPLHMTEYSKELDLYYDVNAWKADESRVAIVFSDITERKRAEEALRAVTSCLEQANGLLGGIIESTAELITAVDTDFRYLALNEAYRRECQAIYGTAPQVGDSMLDMLAPYPEDRQNAIEAFTPAFQGKSVVATHIYGDPGKARRVYEMRVSPIRDAQSRIIGAAHLNTDITERKQAEEALRESERVHAFHAAILTSVRDPLWVTDASLRIVYWNDAATATFGWTADEVLGRNTGELFGTKVPGSTRDDAVAQLRQTGDYRGEAVCHTKDGRPIIVEASSRTVRGPDGEVVRIVSAVRDVSERKRLEEELAQYRDNLERLVAERTEQLQRSERHYRSLVENIPDVVSRYDKDLRYIYRSPRRNGFAADLGGQEVIGKTWTELGIPASLCRSWQEKYREAFNTGSAVQFETQYREKNGGLTDFLVRVVPEMNGAGQVESLLAVSVDITERKRNQELLNAVLEGMKDGFYVLDRELRFIYVNQGMGRVWGLSPAALVGKSIAAVFPGIIEVSLEKFRQALATQTPQEYEVMSRVVNHWYHMYVYPFREGLAVFCLDIHGHKQAKEALRQSEDRFYKIFNTSPVMIVIIRMADNKYVEVNENFLDIIGYTRAEVIGRTPRELGLWAVDAEKGDALLAELAKNGEYHNAEFKIATKTGKIVTALTSSLLITFNGEPCRLATMHDISREKRMEAEMLRLDRLNTVGEMAAAIGHEVRNPMTTVRGYLQMMQRKEELAGHRGQLATMIEELDRANTIISDFLALARNKAVEKRSGSLNDAIGALLPLMQAEALRSGHEISLELGEIPEFAMDGKEIRQLIINLANNALQAMEKGGRLTIGTRAGKGEVALTIRDTGGGIPEEVLARLGTPFLTTKENGTGLGLAVCYRIAERHGARITVETSPQGTAFTVTFSV